MTIRIGTSGWSYDHWDGVLYPPDLTVKAPRGLTHAKRLYSPEAWVERICRSWHALRDHRGVLLVQLHPAHERDVGHRVRPAARA